MEYKVNSGIWGNMFGVPCIVADNLLKFASGDNLKVLLYVLRNSGTTVKTEEISANTGVAEQLVEESILFWEQFNIFSHENSTNQPHSNNINIVPAPAVPEQIPQNPVPVKKTKDNNETAVQIFNPKKKVIYKPTEISELKITNQDIAELLQMMQGVIANPNNYIVNVIIYAYQYLGLKVEVIMTLLNYCLSVDKINANYIEDLALNWAENGINTIDRAIAEVERLIKLKEYTSQFMKICGNMQDISRSMKKMINNCYEAGYNMEMVQYAYERTLEQCGGKFVFNYINGIFNKWIKKGIRNIQDVKNDATEHKKNYKPKNDGSSGGFDADKYDIVVNNF